jgi:hypothetical protein
MRTPTLAQLIRNSTNYYNKTTRIFNTGGELYWTNGHIIIKKDPSIEKTIGKYNLDRLFEEKEDFTEYQLEITDKKIQVIGEISQGQKVKGKGKEWIRNVFSKNLEDLEKIETVAQNIEDRKETLLLTGNKEMKVRGEIKTSYFEYIMSIDKKGYNEIYLNQEESCTYFTINRETRGIIKNLKS